MKLKTKIFADTADLKSLKEMKLHPHVKGFTTNPSLMRKAGVTDYTAFAEEALKIAKDMPISFEVFADDLKEMESQALEIASWGKNVFVKIPVTNTKGESTKELIHYLSRSGVSLNITAIFTIDQIEIVATHLHGPAILSIFAGRIADTGVDPIPLMKTSLELIKEKPFLELLWASPRELLNLIQANEIGCHIITMTPDMIKKTSLLNKNLKEYSLETVRTFYTDAKDSQFNILSKTKIGV